MLSKPGEEPAGKELIASPTFCSLTIKEMSPGLERSAKKSSRDGEGCFYYYYYYYLVCWLTGCTPKQKPTVNSVIQWNSSKSDCVPSEMQVINLLNCPRLITKISHSLQLLLNNVQAV
jgi:hypothetical protein